MKNVFNTQKTKRHCNYAYNAKAAKPFSQKALVQKCAAAALSVGLLGAVGNAYAISCSATADTWGGGYVLNVTVTNDTNNAISNWALALNYDQAAAITNSWNASVSANGNVVNATNIG